MIAPSHGQIWTDPGEIIGAYVGGPRERPGRQSDDYL